MARYNTITANILLFLYKMAELDEPSGNLKSNLIHSQFQRNLVLSVNFYLTSFYLRGKTKSPTKVLTQVNKKYSYGPK